MMVSFSESVTEVAAAVDESSAASPAADIVERVGGEEGSVLPHSLDTTCNSM